MTYHFAPVQPLADAVRGVAAFQVAEAQNSLENADAGLEAAIHDARKRFKKIRALIRLVRPGFDGYKGANAFFRNRGRELSAVRDAQVLLETFDTYIAAAESTDGRRMVAVRNWLDDNRQNVIDNSGVAARVDKVLAELKKARKSIKNWKLDGDAGNIIEEGIAKTYARAHHGLEAAAKDPTAENLHEWRKRAKYHWYHCRLIRDAWPAVMKARIGELDRLADLLGDRNDLAVLLHTLHDKARADLAPETMTEVERTARRQQATLDHDAFHLGRLLFAEKPKPLANRLAGHWQTAAAGAAPVEYREAAE